MRHLILALTVLLPACTSWHPVELPTPTTAEWAVEGRLRLTTLSGDRISGYRAWVVGDTLRVRSAPSSTVRLGREAIARLERRGFDGSRTAGLGFGLLILGVITAVSVGDALSGGILGGGGGF